MTKLVIIAAPSGAGKTTIVKYLYENDLNLKFSVSATTRKPRDTEENGINYLFLSPIEFKRKIDDNEFLEWEEVYKGKFYGTLKSTVEDILSENNVIFDIDVAGGMNIKNHYKDRALSIFITPPSIGELERRLIFRGENSYQDIKERVEKASKEIDLSDNFDIIICNEDLEKTKKIILELVKDFLNGK